MRVEGDRLGLALARDEAQAGQAEVAGGVLQPGHEAAGDALPALVGIDPEAPDLADGRRRSGSGTRRPTPPSDRSGGTAAASHQKGPGRRVEHGRGEALLAVVEEAVAHHELGLGLCHHPLGPSSA